MEFNSHLSLGVASLDKMLHDNYLCLVESNKQQIREDRNIAQPENSETKTTPKRVWIQPMYIASVSFSRQEGKNEEINQSKTKRYAWFQLYGS